MDLKEILAQLKNSQIPAEFHVAVLEFIATLGDVLGLGTTKRPYTGKRRGRPPGSKNKPKEPAPAPAAAKARKADGSKRKAAKSKAAPAATTSANGNGHTEASATQA